jgi:hypothetical protein
VQAQEIDAFEQQKESREAECIQYIQSIVCTESTIQSEAKAAHTQ